MPCLMVFSFGWSWEFVSRAIVSRGGVSESDLVVLVAPLGGVSVEEERYRRAVDAVKRFVLNIGGREPVEVSVNANVEFEDLVASVSRELSKLLPGFTCVEFYLIGGMRLLVLALLFSALILQGLGVKVEVYGGPENLPRVTRIPISSLGATMRFTRRQIELLRNLIALGEARSGSLGSSVGVDPSTARRFLERFVGRGLVLKSRRGPRIVYKATGIAKAIVVLHDSIAKS